MGDKEKNAVFPAASWSSLTWDQLVRCWAAKVRYGGNADVARTAALLSLLGLKVCRHSAASYNNSGEPVFVLEAEDGGRYTATPRELSCYAKRHLQWFDYPYGDAGEKEEKDELGNVTNEKRNGVPGYVSPMMDAMILSADYVAVAGDRIASGDGKLPPGRRLARRMFALPQMACSNLTWQQYRALQALVPQLFGDGADGQEALELQAQFLAHCLTPRSLALLDTFGGSIRIRPHWEYRYSADRAEELVAYWRKKLEPRRPSFLRRLFRRTAEGLQEQVFALHALFYICFQCYQTAVQYYSNAYPLLFSDDGKKDTMRDALQGEVGTVNTVMKYAGYSEQQQVYDSNLPFVLDILNTMAKEAKEIEKMNSKIKKK